MFILLAEWFFIITAVMFFFPAAACADNRRYGWSGFFTLLIAGALGWEYWDQIKEFYAVNGVVAATLAILICYSAAGIATAFIYWFSYVLKARDRYEQMLEQKLNLKIPEAIKELRSIFGSVDPHDELVTLYAKHELLSDAQLRLILDDYHNDLTFPGLLLKKGKLTNDENGVVYLRGVISEVIPPKFKVCRYFIVWAAVEWPITLVWLLISRFVRQVVEQVLKLFRGVFDQVSRFAFGKV